MKKIGLIAAALFLATPAFAQIPEYTISKEMREAMYLDNEQIIVDYLQADGIKLTQLAVDNQWSSRCSARTEDMNIEIYYDGIKDGKEIAGRLCFFPQRGVYDVKVDYFK